MFSRLRTKACGCALALLGLWMGTQIAVHAQVTTADVLGTVTDSTGAVVPGATITITNQGTGVRAKTQSNQVGDYVFNLLIPGNYMVTVEGRGFKKIEFQHITLAAGDRLREDARLQPGSVAETVEVTAAPPLLATDSSAVNSVVTEQAVQDLPLNGRNFVNLVQLQPGVNAGEPNAISSGQRPDDRRANSTISANGQPESFNNQMIEGMDNNERFQGFLGVRPSIDAIAEVKVDTNNYDAEIGRAAGAVVNIITKSGANVYHGSAYDYFRNDIFDARSFFATQGLVPKPEYRQNQFGGSVGGPIMRNHTFFFGDVEDNRVIQGLSSGKMTVPTLYEEQNPGDFTDIGGPFVSSALLNPVGLTYFKMFPKPNISSTASTNNYTTVVTEPQMTFSADGRIDQHFNNGDLLFGRYSYNNVSTDVPSWFPDVSADGMTFSPNGDVASSPAIPGDSITKAHGVQFDYVHTFKPNLVMELKTGYTRIDVETRNLNYGKNVSSAIGVVNANTPAAPQTTGLMPLDFLTGGYPILGDTPFVPILDRNNIFQYMGSITYTHGAHNLKAGAQLTRRQLNYYQSPYPLGLVAFDGLTGNSLEDLLTGLAVGWERSNVLIEPGYRVWESGEYVQDNWRLNQRLTLNLGVRYDLFTPFTEAHGKYANFNYPTLTYITAAMDPHVGIQANYKNVAPRIGFSETLLKGTVLHGGFGISYYPSTMNETIELNSPAYLYSNTCIPCIGNFTFPDLPVPGPRPLYPLTGSPTYAPKNFNTSYVEGFNLMLQQEFGANVFTLGGVGELSRHELFQASVNTPNPTGPYTNDATQGPPAPPEYLTATTAPDLEAVGIASNGGTGNYYALQAVFARRFTNGLGFNLNYTWSHGLSDATSGTGSGQSVTGLIYGNPHYDYGNSFVDVRNRLVAAWNYKLPFAKGATGVRGALIKGWETNSILFWQTGMPFTVGNSYANPNGVAQINLPNVTTDRPDVTGQPYRVSNPSISNWINLNAFTPQAAGTAGNEHSMQFYGPHLRRADLSVFKIFPLEGNSSLEFRAECFNISNTPNFSTPLSTIEGWAPGPEHTATTPIATVGLLPGDTPTNAGGFGSITNTVSNINPRQFQFALKFLF